MKTFRLFLELNHENAEELQKWHDEEGQLSFDNIFGDKVRVVVPLPENEWSKIKQKIETLINAKTGQPQNYHVDLAKGIVTQKGQTLQGKPFERQIKLGKVIQQELGPEEKAYYNRVGNPTPDAIKNVKYSVVISRHPIDVARMSDHEGIEEDEENQDGIESCHSPGGSYFHCALHEAKGHGPVAYLVRTDDLQKVDDLQDDEIFKDPKRKVPGIVPVARLRLRRFKHDRSNYDLAIPEKRIYGVSASSDIGRQFIDSVMEWSRKSQKDTLNGKRPRLKDFTRTGGSYKDTSSGELFNRFFDDDLDSGETSYEGGEDQSLVDQWDQEITELEATAKFKNPISCTAEIEEGEDPQQPYVYCSANVAFYFEDEDDEQWEFWYKWRKGGSKIHDWEKEIKDAAEEGSGEYGVENITIQKDHSSQAIHVYLDLRDDGEGTGPDQYRSLISTCHDWDEHYDGAKNAIRKKFEELGLMGPTLAGRHVADWTPEKFKNFVFHNDRGDVKIMSRLFDIGTTVGWKKNPNTQTRYVKSDRNLINLGLGKVVVGAGNHSYSTVKDDEKGISDLKKGLEMSIMQMIRQSRELWRKQLLLPFTGNTRRFLPSPKWPLGKMDIEIRDNYKSSENGFGYDLEGQIIFNLGYGMDQKTLTNTEHYVKYLDDNFTKIVETAQRMLQTHVHPHFNPVG